MTVIDLLSQHISDYPQDFGLSKQISQREIHITLHTPKIETATGRIHYKIYVGQKPTPVIFAQVAPLACNSPLADRNPYYPNCGNVVDSLTDILPKPTGEIVYTGRKIYWSKYIPWPSLQTRLNDIASYLDISIRLRQPPWSTVLNIDEQTNLSSNLLTEYVAMAQHVCSLLGELEQHQLTLKTLLFKGWDKLKFGFSHGDLWCQDILRSETGQFCILDWEWAALARPMGIDLFHFYLTTLQYHYDISMGEALTCLIWGYGQIETEFRHQLRRLWDELGYCTESRRVSVFTYLIYIQNRKTLQIPGTLPGIYLDIASTLSMAIVSQTYLKALIKTD